MENNSPCLDLPTNLNRVTVIWNRQPGFDEDCECPVYVNSAIPFRDCYCFQTDPITPFNVDIVDNTLCWFNLTRVTNDTRIILARTDFINNSYYRVIYNLTRLIVQGKKYKSCIHYCV